MPHDATNVREISKMKVSVVIIAYNEEMHIAESISSILEQSYRPSQIIVVNDGSKDGTLREMNKFASSITIVNKIKNRGRAKAYASGFFETNGDVVAFIDGDSKAPKNWIKDIVNGFEQHPDAACVGGYYIGSNTNKLLPNLESSYNKIGARLGLFKMPSGTNVAYKRSVLHKFRAFESLPKWRPDKHPMDVLIKNKYKIVFRPFYVYSAMPETLGQYTEQKIRWGRDGIPLDKKISSKKILVNLAILISPLVIIPGIFSQKYFFVLMIFLSLASISIIGYIFFKFKARYSPVHLIGIFLLKSLALYLQAMGFGYELLKSKFLCVCDIHKVKNKSGVLKCK